MVDLAHSTPQLPGQQITAQLPNALPLNRGALLRPSLVDCWVGLSFQAFEQKASEVSPILLGQLTRPLEQCRDVSLATYRARARARNRNRRTRSKEPITSTASLSTSTRKYVAEVINRCTKSVENTTVIMDMATKL